MDAPCCYNAFVSGGMPFQNHPILISLPPAPSFGPPKLVFSPLVAVRVRAHRGDRNADGGASSMCMTQLMFRNLAALLYRSVPRGKPKAEPAGSSSRFPPPEPGSDSEEEEEGGVSEEMAEKLECLEEEAMEGSPEGREPGDYNRRAHLFDESSRVFQALKERKEEDRQRHHEGS